MEVKNNLEIAWKWRGNSVEVSRNRPRYFQIFATPLKHKAENVISYVIRRQLFTRGAFKNTWYDWFNCVLVVKRAVLVYSESSDRLWVMMSNNPANTNLIGQLQLKAGLLSSFFLWVLERCLLASRLLRPWEHNISSSLTVPSTQGVALVFYPATTVYVAE